MAKLIFLHAADIRGKLAGNVFSKNSFANYIRAKTSPVNAQTPAQTSVRADFGSLAQTWRTLTDTQRFLWQTSAINFLQTNVFGQSFNYTGFNLYMHINRWRQEINIAVTTTPVAPAQVTNIQADSLTIDNGGTLFEVAFTPAIPADHSVIVYATTGLSAGINFVKSFYRKIDVLTDVDLSPKNLFAEYNAVFSQLPLAGMKAFVKFRPVLNTGIPGVETQRSDIAV